MGTGAMALFALILAAVGSIQCIRKKEKDDDDDDDDEDEDEYEEGEIRFDLETNDSSHSSTWSDSIYTVDSFANDEHNAVYRPAFGVPCFNWNGQNNGLKMREDEIIE